MTKDYVHSVRAGKYDDIINIVIDIVTIHFPDIFQPDYTQYLNCI